MIFSAQLNVELPIPTPNGVTEKHPEISSESILLCKLLQIQR